MMKKVRIGVVGGVRGRYMMQQSLDDPVIELVAICDVSPRALDTCKKNLAEHSGITYYDDFDEFLKHDMDAVALANFAHEHVPLAIKALDAGFHVMTECVTCATMKEAVELIEAVERSGKIYMLAENACYTIARWEMRERFRRGDIGELMYAEGEYLHNGEPIWGSITGFRKNHWRNEMASTFYCTHSIGPILTITGLRPVQVVGYETQSLPYMRNVGYGGGCAGMEIITLENGAILKSLHGNVKKTMPRSSKFQLNGTLGAMNDLDGGLLATYIEQPGKNGEGENNVYTPAPVVEGAEKYGHGGGDFFTTYYFSRAILGDKTALERIIDVYTAVDMCIPGILAYRSIVNGNVPIKIPDLRNKDERDRYRNDTFCTFPKIAGDMYVSNNVQGDPEIPEEFYEKLRQKKKNK